MVLGFHVLLLDIFKPWTKWQTFCRWHFKCNFMKENICNLIKISHYDVIKLNLFRVASLSFHVTGPLWGKSTGYQWIPLTKAIDVELLCFLWSAPEQTVEQTIEMPVIWNTITLIMLWLNSNENELVLVFHELRFQLLAPSQCWQNCRKLKLLICWLVLKFIKDVFTLWMLSCILFDPSRSN